MNDKRRYDVAMAIAGDFEKYKLRSSFVTVDQFLYDLPIFLKLFCANNEDESQHRQSKALNEGYFGTIAQVTVSESALILDELKTIEGDYVMFLEKTVGQNGTIWACLLRDKNTEGAVMFNVCKILNAQKQLGLEKAFESGHDRIDGRFADIVENFTKENESHVTIMKGDRVILLESKPTDLGWMKVVHCGTHELGYIPATYYSLKGSKRSVSERMSVAERTRYVLAVYFFGSEVWLKSDLCVLGIVCIIIHFPNRRNFLMLFDHWI